MSNHDAFHDSPVEFGVTLVQMDASSMRKAYARRQSRDRLSRLYRVVQPPLPLIHNVREPIHFPLGRWNLYVGGAGSRPEGYVNVDLFALPGVDVAADAELLPFPSSLFQCIECDAVLEHVRHPEPVLRELSRVLAPGGHLHVVVPFCHPFHAYPADYRRFTPDGVKQMVGGELEVIAEGWRTGPTATLLVFVLD